MKGLPGNDGAAGVGAGREGWVVAIGVGVVIAGGGGGEATAGVSVTIADSVVVEIVVESIGEGVVSSSMTGETLGKRPSP